MIKKGGFNMIRSKLGSKVYKDIFDHKCEKINALLTERFFHSLFCNETSKGTRGTTIKTQ
jgi:hypothetical protein